MLAFTAMAVAQASNPIKVRLEWGHTAPANTDYYIKLITTGAGGIIQNVNPVGIEAGESATDGAWETKAGGGDVDGLDFTVTDAARPAHQIQNVQVIWADLIKAADADTALRLGRDAAMEPDSPRVTVQMNREGTRGFTVTVDQLRREKAFWIPSLHVFLSTGDHPVSFAEYLSELTPFSGKRILESVKKEPEATYKEFTSLWADMGSPAYTRPNQPAPGHIVCLTWDSAIPKFGIDRGAGVWNDYGNPDHFRFWFDFGDLTKGITDSWKDQRLQNGLPVITTTFEKDGTRYEVEQFAYPLNGPPSERRGDIPMVLMQRLRLTDLTGRERVVPVSFTHLRGLSQQTEKRIMVDHAGEAVLFRDNAYRDVLFSVTGAERDFIWNGTVDYQHEMKRVDGTLFAHLPASGTATYVVKLASPVVAAKDLAKLQAINYDAARKQTIDFWRKYVDRGARFEVPETTVNEMFNASLWRALMLPRRHGAAGPDVAIDLPYSNFAYSQTGTPWPVNQAVYVDYMLYDLRGYHAISTEELLAQYRNNQEFSGHVNGYANWVVYTPGMLYTVAKSYLLSGDRAAFEKLLPASMKAFDWCLEQVRSAQTRAAETHGLVKGPLNDLTGEGLWSFNQAYMYAGLEVFGRALARANNPRAGEAKVAAQAIFDAVQRAFGAAAMRSPIVQLRDHTWQPYVPCEAETYRRLLDEWYPADVDTGAVHLIRLGALPPRSELADWLLNDHEDNLYYKGRGIANEPVYVQQATAYLLRDDVEAVIRAFYSLMASGFSHSVYEPVEHRWTHGQYFGPPSTDGAWFELYRNMLVRETDQDTLLLGQATPRAWLANGKSIEVNRAPTYYGDLTFKIESRSASGQIRAHIDLAERTHPRDIVVRFRHPDHLPIRSVTVNGSNWTDFDVNKEWVTIPNPTTSKYDIVASY